MGGAEDVRTRYYGWRFLGFIRSAFEEGPPAALREPRGCQAEKRPALDGALRHLTRLGRGFPEVAQLAVVRIGGLLLAAVPVEALTAARGAAGRSRGDRGRVHRVLPERVAVLGLTNGFMQYVAARASIAPSSTRVRPRSTGRAPRTRWAMPSPVSPAHWALRSPSPEPAIDSLLLQPGPADSFFPSAGTPAKVQRRIVHWGCTEDGIALEWEDAQPGALDHSTQLLSRIDRVDDGTAETVARDDGAPSRVRSAGRGRGAA